jgi:hypothetical protein
MLHYHRTRRGSILGPRVCAHDEYLLSSSTFVLDLRRKIVDVPDHDHASVTRYSHPEDDRYESWATARKIIKAPTTGRW